MLTALSVARDCGIVPPGQRVIMVQTSNDQSKKPNVYFTQSRGASSPDTAVIFHNLLLISLKNEGRGFLNWNILKKFYLFYFSKWLMKLVK